MNSTIMKLTDLKTRRDGIESKLRSLKTKAARSKQWDKLREIKVELREMLDLIMSNLGTDDLKRFNIMAYIGGPYCLLDADKIEWEYGGHMVITYGDERYAGRLEMMDKLCGIDNLNILINLLNTKGV